MKLFVTIIGVLLGGMVLTTEGDGVKLLDRTDVAIVNQIQGEKITIHCYSSEDDLGTHDLSFGQNLSWSFDVNFFHSTKFYCDFTTAPGCGNYAVYDRKLEVRCDKRCVWNVRERGPCLIQTAYYNIEWCQDWKQRNCGRK